MLRTTLLVLALLGYTRAECPNACSGHGECKSYDKCHCYRNWQAADCSQRTCPFGFAHVDTPKGNLDGSVGALSGNADDDWAVTQVVDVYHQFGTQEQYPKMADTAGTVKDDSAHWYQECSNKGICDRATGLCKCITGYEGHACQRASCPNACSGHGTCESIEDLARWDHDNIYKLWDRKMTMGCKCDPGYDGPDCSLRTCKVGIDPLYTNLYTTANMASWEINLEDPDSNGIAGTYAIKFFDSFGEDYITEPIVHEPLTDYCDSITSALEALPNSVIPLSSVACHTSKQTDTEHTYTVTFTKNPGKLHQIEVEQYLDGTRATLYSTNSATGGTITPATVNIANAGAPGEYTDYFTNFCEGVVVKMENLDKPWWGAAKLVFTGDEWKQQRLLKQCLGDSDGNPANNRDYENWDHGDWSIYGKEHIVGRFPHAIKLVKKDRIDEKDSGHVNLLWYSNHTGIFKLLSQRPLSHTDDTEYYVFTTDGVAEQMLFDYEETGDSYENTDDIPVTGWWYKYSDTIFTNLDASCETGSDTLSMCLKKGDMIMIPAAGYGYARSNATTDDFGLDAAGYVGDLPSMWNSTYDAGDVRNLSYTGQIYTVTKIWKEPPGEDTMDREDRYRIKVDKNINWDASELGRPYGYHHKWNIGYQYIFRFWPNSSYTYVSECSNRGSCDRTSGLCQCYKGYTMDNCDTQSALAV